VIDEGAVTISKVELLNKTFSRSLFGYRSAQVDLILQEAAESIGLLAEREKNLKDTVAKLERILADHRSREETLRDALLTAQKMVETLKENAKEEAARIVEQARRDAQIITGEAARQLARIREEIDLLSRRRARFESELRAVINEHLQLIEGGAPSSREKTLQEERASASDGAPDGSSGAFIFSEESA